MKVKINGYDVEGTPEEVKQLIGADKKIKYVPVYPQYPSYPNTGDHVPYWPNWPTITWC